MSPVSRKLLMILLVFGLIRSAQANSSMNHLQPSQAKLTPEQVEHLRQALQILIEGGGIEIDEQTGQAKVDESLLETLKRKKLLETKPAEAGGFCLGG